MPDTTVPEAGPTPVIVLGSGASALGVVRSLRHIDAPVFMACPARDLAARSRWYRPVPGTHPWDGTLGDAGLAALAALPLRRAAIIPTADDAALWLSAWRDHPLAARFVTSSSPRDTLELLQDKVRFAQLLAGTEVAHPRTYTIAQESDLRAIPFEALDRVFLKPADSQKFSDITGLKAVWADGRTEFEEKWRRFAEQGIEVVAQEYVPGKPSDHYFVDGFRDRAGRITGMMARRRVRIFPLDFGNSSYCRSIPLADIPEAVAGVTGLLDRLAYRGIFSAEFKRDARDGAYRLLEINTRAWTYIEFATHCGVNVARMAYEDALERPVGPGQADYSVGKGCLDLYRDLNAVRATRSTDRDSLPTILWQWASAHFHAFRFDDPRPGLYAARQIVRRALSSRIRGKKRR